jgi:hypothetical protein
MAPLLMLETPSKLTSMQRITPRQWPSELALAQAQSSQALQLHSQTQLLLERPKYPSNYVPNPADIDPDVMRSFLDSKRCLGWFEESVCIGGIEHAVRPLLLDLEPGKDLYVEPHCHRSALMEDYVSHRGTFRHRECEG